MKKFAVVESNDSFIVCHGSGLTRTEAQSLVMSQMLHYIGCTEDNMLNNVKMFELEANELGLGVSFEWNGNKTTCYILDDSGKPE